MGSLESEVDASFFSMIHRLAAVPRPEAAERRSARRHSFPVTQRIAPRDGSNVPDESEFVDVPCHDLTRGGFSFFLPKRPTFDSLVVALERPEGTIHVAADVVRQADVLLFPSGRIQDLDQQHTPDSSDEPVESATPMVVVGCRFTERLAP